MFGYAAALSFERVSSRPRFTASTNSQAMSRKYRGLSLLTRDIRWELVTTKAPSPIDVAALRQNYMQRGLNESDLAPDPLAQFEAWLHDAVNCPSIREPNAMVLATVSADGQPHARAVLLKGLGPAGFVFYTNYQSDKARELEAQPLAALTFAWVDLERQVRIEGAVEKTSQAEVKAYFQTRPRGSRLGAWVSPQSRVIAGRSVLEAGLAEADARFPGEVPVPENWGGFRVVPSKVEFWQGRPNRLHDRLRYRKEGGLWVIERLAP
jgi:pyridoxamine 5'-phosphate oxidase